MMETRGLLHVPCAGGAKVNVVLVSQNAGLFQQTLPRAVLRCLHESIGATAKHHSVPMNPAGHQFKFVDRQVRSMGSGDFVEFELAIQEFGPEARMTVSPACV
jgi:hypothetical protein